MSTSSSSSITVPYNYSFHAIGAAYALAFPPYLYQFAKGMVASNYTSTNITPRTNLDTIKSQVDSKTFSKLVRARGCHLNALEGFPLFAAAMLAGSYAQLSPRDMNFYAAEYLTARVMYSVVYMTARSEAASYLRSGVYAWSVGIPFYVLWKAGNRLAEQI